MPTGPRDNRMQKRADVKDIRDIVCGVIGNMSSERGADALRVEDCFIRLLKEPEIPHILLKGLKDGQLYVNVDSSVWLYAMRVRTGYFLKEIQKDFPDIKRLYFKIGSVK